MYNEFVVVYQCDEGYKIAHTSNPDYMPGDRRYGTNPKLVLSYACIEVSKARDMTSRVIGYLYPKHVGKAIFKCSLDDVKAALDEVIVYYLDTKKYFQNL